MSTPTGQSALHPLHDRHRSRASRTSVERQPSVITSPWVISYSRRARPRVESFSSRVTPVAGAHDVAAVVGVERHLPTPTQRRVALAKSPSSAWKGKTVARGSGVRCGLTRRFPSTGSGSDDHPGVEAVVGVPERLELLEQGDDLGAVHQGQQLGAGLAVAVLAGQRTAVGGDQPGGIGDEGAEDGGALLGGEVEVDADVQTALAEVPVDGAL